jgi:hypothetical protein
MRGLSAAATDIQEFEAKLCGHPVRVVHGRLFTGVD